MERYIVNGRIGEGAHGIVLKGIDKSTMKLVAMKRIALKNINEQGLPNSAVRELLALRLIRHEYVVNLVDYFPQGYSLVLVFEYLPIDLYEFLRSNSKPLPTSHVKSCTIFTSLQSDCMHSNNQYAILSI
jgi:serine/threonine protein kinase